MPKPHYTERGKPWSPSIQGPDNNKFFNIGPGDPEWLKWIMWPAAGWTIGNELSKEWAKPNIPYRYPVNQSPQFNPDEY